MGNGIEEFFDDKAAFYKDDVGNNNDRNYHEYMEAIVRRCSSK